MKSDAQYFAILHEEMNAKFDVLAEGIADIRRRMATKEELNEVKADVKVIKAAVMDLSRKVDNHERRITRLEKPRAKIST